MLDDVFRVVVLLKLIPDPSHHLGFIVEVFDDRGTVHGVVVFLFQRLPKVPEDGNEEQLGHEVHPQVDSDGRIQHIDARPINKVKGPENIVEQVSEQVQTECGALQDHNDQVQLIACFLSIEEGFDLENGIDHISPRDNLEDAIQVHSDYQQ